MLARDRRDREGDVDRARASATRARYFELDGAQCDPKPLQQPHPPIWIGGGGEQLTLRVVARHATHSNFGGKPHEWAHKAEVLKGHCDGGRARLRRDHQDVVARGVHPRDRGRGRRRRQPQSFWGEPVESWRRATSSARPSRCAEKIQAYVDLGCTGVRALVQRLPRHRDPAPLRRKGDPELPLTPRGCGHGQPGGRQRRRARRRGSLHGRAVGGLGDLGSDGRLRGGGRAPGRRRRVPLLPAGRVQLPLPRRRRVRSRRHRRHPAAGRAAGDLAARLHHPGRPGDPGGARLVGRRRRGLRARRRRRRPRSPDPTGCPRPRSSPRTSRRRSRSG